MLKNIVIIVFTLLSHAFGRFTEQERVEYWRQHHTWPPTWQPEREGYRKLMEQREREIMELPASDERWENWMQYTIGRMLPSFTQNGYEVATVPPAVFAKLKKAVDKGLENFENLREENHVEAIYVTPGFNSKFIDLGGIASEVHRDLLPYHEKWAGGIKLRPTSAYGVRLYRNGSSLLMHHDKV
jgi:hypothetical protein